MVGADHSSQSGGLIRPSGVVDQTTNNEAARILPSSGNCLPNTTLVAPPPTQRLPPAPVASMASNTNVTTGAQPP